MPHLPPQYRRRGILAALLVYGSLAGCTPDQSTASLLAEAKQYQQKGDQKAALIQLRNAVAKSPDDGEARFQLSSQYLYDSDAVSAEKEVRRAMASGIPASRTLPVLGQSLLAQGQFKKLIDEISADAAKQSAPLLALRGDALLALNDDEKSKQAYAQALILQPNLGQALLGMSKYSIKVHDAPNAARYMNEALEKDASNPDVWMFQAIVLRSKGKADDAIAAYGHVLKLKPDHRSAALERAQLEIALGKYDAAKADLAASAKLAPDTLALSYTQALLDFNQGNYAAARDNLLKVQKIAVDYLPAVLLAGATEMKLGSTQQAAQYLRQYLQSYPAHVDARKMLAQSLLANADPVEATEVLAPLLQDPASVKDVQLLQIAAETASRSKNYQAANTYLEQAIALAPKNGSLHTSYGLSRLALGDPAKGISELERGVALDPASVMAAETLIKAQVQLRQFDAALASVQALETRSPKEPMVPELKGLIYAARGDKANARASLEQAFTAKPTSIALATQLAQLDLADGQLEKARGRFTSLLAVDKKNIAAMTTLAELALKQNDVKGATGWLEKASAENPSAIAPVTSLARLYLQTNEQQKALLLMRKLQAANPTNPEVLDVFGQSQAMTGDGAGAVETYSKLVAIAPKSANAFMRLASAHVMKGNLDAADADLKRAVALDPLLTPARLGQMQLAMQRQKPDEALAIARTVQKLPRQAAVGYALEGDLLMAQGKPALALPVFEKSFSLEQNTVVLIKIALALKQTGKAAEVETRLLAWQQSHPADLMAAGFLAENAMANKQTALATTRLEALLKQWPDDIGALNNLALIYQQEKNPQALPVAQKAAALAPANPSVLDTLGWIQVSQGNPKDAVTVLQKATTLSPDTPTIRYHLAVALNNAGDKATARKELEKLLASKKSFGNIDDAKALLKNL